MTVLPPNWDFTPHGIRLSVAATDDFGMPYEKRGVHVIIPTDIKDHAKFAESLAENVRETVMFILSDVPRSLAKP